MKLFVEARSIVGDSVAVEFAREEALQLAEAREAVEGFSLAGRILGRALVANLAQYTDESVRVIVAGDDRTRRRLSEVVPMAGWLRDDVATLRREIQSGEQPLDRLTSARYTGSE